MITTVMTLRLSRSLRYFEKVGGVGNDVNRLDGDKDGEACESLPKGVR